MKIRERHLYEIAVFLSILIVFAPLSSFYVLADTTTSSSVTSSSGTSSSTTSTITTTTATLDTTPPKIGTVLEIKKNGEDVKYIGPKGISRVDITVEITEATNPTVYFDLSNVGGSASVPARVCSKSGTVWKCSLLGITITSSTGQIKIPVTASDTYGNSITNTVAKTLQLDNTGPDAAFIGTDMVDNGVSYAKTSRNTLVVKLKEAGAGLNDKKIYLDLSKFSGRYGVQADECEQGSGEWTCYWNDINAFGRKSGELLKLSVLSTSTDDVGNAVSGLSEANVILDRDAPKLLNMSITSVGEAGETTYHQSADILKIEANVSDNVSSVTAVADLSNLFLSGHKQDTATCTAYGEHKFNCQWTTEAIKSGYYRTIASFNFSDFVGNELLITESIEVFATSEETPNNFGLVIDEDGMLPAKGISRLTMTLMGNYLISVPFYLAGGSGAEVLRMTMDECKIENDSGLYSTYFQNQDSPELERTAIQANQMNRANFYFGYNGAKFASPQINALDDFPVTCNLKIFQKRGNTIYSVPEVEKFQFEVDLRDSALGGPPGEVVAEKIADMKENWLVESRWITGVHKWLEWAEYICRLGQSLVFAWQQLLVLEGIGKALMSNPTTKPVGTQIFKAGCYMYEAFGSVFWAVWFGSSHKHFGTERCGLDVYQPPTPPPAQPITLAEALAYDKKFNMRWMCGWATCEYGLLELSKYTGGDVLPELLRGVEMGEGEDAEHFLRQRLHIHLDDSFNPRNSILFSAASICLPGVFYHLNKYRQINCRYITCLENVTTAGGDLSVCDEAKSQAWCLTFWGEAFEVIGPARVLGVLSQQIRNMFHGFIPVTLDNIFKSTVCNKPGGEEGKTWYQIIGCDIPSVVYSAIDTYNRASGIGAVFSLKDMFKKPPIEDECAKVFPKEQEGETTTTTTGSGIVTVTFAPSTTTTT